MCGRSILDNLSYLSRTFFALPSASKQFSLRIPLDQTRVQKWTRVCEYSGLVAFASELKLASTLMNHFVFRHLRCKSLCSSGMQFASKQPLVLPLLAS